MVGFITLQEHFTSAWEVHCVAIRAEARGQGHGSRLLSHAEAWLIAKGVRYLQVKTVAASSASLAYAQTREFYARRGFDPLQVFPTFMGRAQPRPAVHQGAAWGLTPPSSGRPPASFACLRPPLMSNVDMASFVKSSRLRAHAFLCDADLIDSRCRTGNATEPWLPPEMDVRRLFMLICEGCVPQDRFSSRGCLRSRD